MTLFKNLAMAQPLERSSEERLRRLDAYRIAEKLEADRTRDITRLYATPRIWL